MLTPEIAPVAHLSIVVPTYKEVENIPHLVARIEQLRASLPIPVDVWLMDDDSKDGSAELVANLGKDWVHFVTRTSDRGLSAAVLDGLRRAQGDVFVVMDADLSHPVEAIPRMLEELNAGADFVLGSRFIAGGTTDDDWGLFRWLNSKVATLLALPLVAVADPMSGFFMLRRSTFEQGSEYSPVGYKIGLELLVKCRCKRPVEVPIHFQDRQYGKSKLTLAEQLRYLQHVRRLYMFRFAFFSQLLQFLAVGGLGVGVNLAVLTAGLAMRIPMRFAVMLAILVSMLTNFFLNRRFSFADARAQSVWRQLLAFVSACSVGAVVNYWVTLWSADFTPVPQVAAIIGVIAGTGFNFLASRYWVFRLKHYTEKRRPKN